MEYATTFDPLDILDSTDLTTFYSEMMQNTSNETNITSSEDGKALPHPLWLTIILGTAASIVIVVTVLGNILVLLSFFLERSIRQPTNYFIASLAMSDLLIGMFSMPCFTLYLLLGYWPLGEIICDLWLSLDWTVCLASQYTVFFITADRFCSVKIPAKYRNWRTDRKVRVMIALSWIIPSLVFFTSIVGWQYFVGERKVPKDQCEVQFMSDPLFTFLLTIGYFWITLIVMIVLYVGIYRVALNLQRKANEKQRKMTNAMEMAKDKSSKKKSGGNKKDSKKRVENNNARYLRGPNDNNTITTSFSKNSDNEYSKPSEEDRSSSPAFASDEDEGSSGERKEGCYVNSAVQTEPTLKGMLGSSFNHMSRLAFSISGTSVSASQTSQGSEKESLDDQPNRATEIEQEKPLLGDLANKFEPIKETKPFDDISAVTNEESEKPPDLVQYDNEVLDGLRYIDEDSLKSLTSSENVKLLAEIRDKPLLPPEAESPIWRKRDDEKALLVPISGDSASSEALSNITDTSKLPEKQTNNVCHHNHRNKSDSHKSRDKHKAEHSNANNKRENHSLAITANHTNAKKKVKESKTYGSPLQSLVKSLRPSLGKDKKAPKSKSENRARKALRTISIILGAYVLCWTPYHIMVFIIGICGDWSCINLKFYYFTYWLCYLNSPINPFCYAFANAQFKRTFIRILKLDFHRT